MFVKGYFILANTCGLLGIYIKGYVLGGFGDPKILYGDLKARPPVHALVQMPATRPSSCPQGKLSQCCRLGARYIGDPRSREAARGILNRRVSDAWRSTRQMRHGETVGALTPSLSAPYRGEGTCKDVRRKAAKPCCLWHGPTYPRSDGRPHVRALRRHDMLRIRRKGGQCLKYVQAANA